MWSSEIKVYTVGHVALNTKLKWFWFSLGISILQLGIQSNDISTLKLTVKRERMRTCVQLLTYHSCLCE